MVKPEPEDHLTWKSVRVDGRQVNYGVAGWGLPVLFVQGWALGRRAYKRALKRLVRLGCQVYAPALPGFGGSSPMPADERNLEGYAARRADLTVDLTEIKARHLPMPVLWGEGDGIIPRARFDALCEALGSAGKVVPGRHTWLLADPDSFGEVMANSVTAAQAAWDRASEPPSVGRHIMATRPADATHAAQT